MRAAAASTPASLRRPRELEAGGDIPPATLAARSPDDVLAHTLADVRACVSSEARCVLCAAGRGRGLGLSEAALQRVAPSGVAFALAALSATLHQLAVLGPAERASTLAEAAAVGRAVREGARAAAAQLVPAARLGYPPLELAERGEPAAAADPVVGRVRLTQDPCAAERGAFDYSLLLSGASADGLPLHFGLRRVAEMQAAHAFSEPLTAGASGPPLAALPPGAAVAVEGVVERKFDMHLTDAGDAEYRRLSRARTAAASSKTRLVRSVAAFAKLSAPGDGGARPARLPASAEEAAPLMVPLPRRANKAAPVAAAANAGVARSDDELQALLFELFERRSHWKVAEIVSVSGETMTRLRPALAKITEMDRRPGPQRGCYQLLPHLKKQEG